MTEPRASTAHGHDLARRIGTVTVIRSATAVWIGGVPALLALIAGLAALAWAGALLVGRVDGLSVPPYDLAFFQQVVWNVGERGAWVSSFHEGSFLGLHFSPILVVPALVERFLWADVRVLNLFHAAAIGAMVPAAFLFLRAVLRPSRLAGWLAAGLAIGLPISGAMQDVIRSDFHPETAGVTFALLAGWAGLTGRPRAMWALALVALATREDLAYAIGVIGLLVAARGRGDLRAHGRVLAFVAVCWAVVVFGVLMPWIRDGAASDTARYYSWLGGGLGVLRAPFTMTDLVAAKLTRPEPWFIVLGMVLSLSGLSLLRPRWVVLVLPPLVALLLSSHRWQADVTLHYSLILVVPLLVSAGLGGRRALVLARRWRRRRRLRTVAPAGVSAPGRRWSAAVVRPSGPAVLVLVAAALPSFAGAFAQGSLPPFDGSDRAFIARPASSDRAASVASRVPASARLIVDEGLVASLAGRASIGSLVAATVPPREAHVLIDRDAWSSGPWEADRRERIVDVLRSGVRPILADDGRFVLFGPEPAGDGP